MNNHVAAAVVFAKNMKALAEFYENVCAMRRLRVDQDHVVLESGPFRLTVHRIPDHISRNITIAVPPVVRQEAAIKLSLQVESLHQSRIAAADFGGALYTSDAEWGYEGLTMCDGYDPEGNVFQVFQRNGTD